MQWPYDAPFVQLVVIIIFISTGISGYNEWSLDCNGSWIWASKERAFCPGWRTTLFFSTPRVHRIGDGVGWENG
jgi:hypothetical protein